ncbi:MAG: hypothetical protein HW387_655 [Parachlamydiales bacterium]|nr:hypothetical protein [Parachlamydiales bacterium]
MLSQEYFTHYPSRLLWSGGGVLGAFVCVSIFLLLPVADQPEFPKPPRKSVQNTVTPATISVDLASRLQRMLWDLPSIEDEIFVSLSTPRPGTDRSELIAHVRLKSVQQSKRVVLPSRIYLCFNDKGVLNFQQEEGPFWIDLGLDDNEMVMVQAGIVNRGQEEKHARFSRCPDAAVLQKAEEFPAGSALRTLGEARWNGPDLLAKLDSTEEKQRLEIASAALMVGENDWIGWKGGRWAKIASPFDARDLMIAKIRAVTPQALEWDVWDSSHTRLATPLQPIPVVHIKTDEWITAIRIRSDKQMSCSIEKQSVILRVGDWVLKDNGRWRVLRKAEERQQVLSGAKSGELFVLEKIDSKQKSIKGKLFLANRSQMTPIETSAVSAKQDKKSLTRRVQRGKSL